MENSLELMADHVMLSGYEYPSFENIENLDIFEIMEKIQNTEEEIYNQIYNDTEENLTD